MKFHNTKKGFVGIVAMIIIVAALTGGGVYVYQKQKVKTDVSGNYDYPATSTTNVVASGTSRTLTPPSSQPVVISTFSSQSNIVWSFPLTKTSESHSSYNVIVTIEGKMYDLQFENSWGAKEVEKSKLLPNQLSAVRLGNGDQAVEFAVEKTATKYVITKATYDYQKDGKEDNAAWRQRTSVIKNILSTVKVEANTELSGTDSKKVSQLKYIGSRYGFNYPSDWSIWTTGNDSVTIYPISKSEEMKMMPSVRIDINLIDKKVLDTKLAQKVVLNGTTWYVETTGKTGISYYKEFNNENYIIADADISNKTILEAILVSLITG